MSLYFHHVLETIHLPDTIYEGNESGLIAEKFYSELNNKFVVVVYKEISETDGFIITAFLSKKTAGLKKKLLWKL